ncbi:hypothetical protein UFOVP964_27 [uncultured Caudovirales phage]|uniref:Baseplate hub assembly protein, bacteriophage T4-like n=1 Tax=uncultured Caudovirales phage TaxID=2100421 RepID=A0A6J5R966_9CAUD|nr:hypothetical protein UFOVP854_27 [uncultured Caudovirales phage]CAB4174118.1 hypothetical protein UFOVP964_27 [uncultured Caudovirales phage]CAB4179511.1 hypothetical protein UFOVP1034_131 [uncultured Caudovirales phage]CAB4189175.1 hypothetical protein UFOVP1177_131 [uncultured Caudovirales phage]CAB4193630.1 hypothetical protein UFOVP1243_118 [uncultured Caudovirales phage]
MTNTISAAVNPAMANNLIESALAEKTEKKEAKVLPPLDNVVTLPGGYVTSAGEVITTAEVRELTGKDEEAIARASTTGKALLAILNRGTVKIGAEKADEALLDRLLSGDRDTLLLSILKMTFGNEADLPAFCDTCEDFKTVTVDLNADIKVKVMTDPINDRVFTVQGKRNEFTVQMPTGFAQKELIANSDKTAAELNTILLENTIIKIDSSPVLTKMQVQNMGILDRRTVLEEINKRVVGPQFDSLTVTCPDCEGEVQVPISLGALFRF